MFPEFVNFENISKNNEKTKELPDNVHLEVETNIYVYYGTMKNGKFHGTGELIFKSFGITYQSDNWVNGNCSYGKIIHLKYLYIGYIKNGTFNGFGKLVLKNTNYWYYGNFQNGKFNGYGVFYGHNKSSEYIEYTGSFKHGVFDGFGKLILDHGAIIHEGLFKNDKLNGEGIISKYEFESMSSEYIYRDSGIFENGILVKSSNPFETKTLQSILLNPLNPGTFQEIMINDEIFQGYVESRGLCKYGKLLSKFNDIYHGNININGYGKLVLRDGTNYEGILKNVNGKLILKEVNINILI